VDAGEEGGFIEEDEREMIYSIFELGDTLAREVMVPRVDVISVEVNTPITDALAVIVEGGHSRIPVYQDTIDDIVGMLYAKDLLRYWPDNENLVLKDILREVHYVPETKPVDKLLQELQQMKVHIAVVVDEFGGVAGLVTIEDILEEIVGEIQDEYDTEEDFMEVVGENEVIFNSRTDLDDVNHGLGIELPTDSSDTLGGLMYSSLGRVPVVGDKVSFKDAELTILSVVGRRIKKIKVKRLVTHPSESRDYHSGFLEGASRQNTASIVHVPGDAD
jgi:putative hemolysin